MCITFIDDMICCEKTMVKNGKTKANAQRFLCKRCGVTKQENYSYQACSEGIDKHIVVLIKEGVGIRSTSRVLNISPTTVLKRLVSISAQIQKPPIRMGRRYEVDELMTFIGNKEHRICIAYALDRETREVVSFSLGRRNLKTLRIVVNSLLLSETKEIRTDKCPLYKSLIPTAIHHVKRRGINRIERMNLTLRNHLKRLNRRTIAYSKSLLVLSAILKIYFFS